MRTYVAEKETLLENIRAVKRQADGVPVWAVLKGDGYGLGVVPMAGLLREEGIGRFCVTDTAGAQALRDAGFTEERILMLQPTTDRAVLETLLDLNVICTVSCQDDAVALNGIAAGRSTVAEVHIKLDTGMGRYGFLPEEFNQITAIFQYMDHIAVSGIYTHFLPRSALRRKQGSSLNSFKSCWINWRDGDMRSERHTAAIQRRCSAGRKCGWAASVWGPPCWAA